VKRMEWKELRVIQTRIYEAIHRTRSAPLLFAVRRTVLTTIDVLFRSVGYIAREAPGLGRVNLGLTKTPTAPETHNDGELSR
jgi:hypothetical protein